MRVQHSLFREGNPPTCDRENNSHIAVEGSALFVAEKCSYAERFAVTPLPSERPPQMVLFEPQLKPITPDTAALRSEMFRKDL